MRSGPWKYQFATKQLFNLETDLGEKNNEAKNQPEIVSKLEKLAETMKADLGDKTADAPGVRPLGRVTDPKPLLDSAGNVRAGFDAIAKTLP